MSTYIPTNNSVTNIAFPPATSSASQLYVSNGTTTSWTANPPSTSFNDNGVPVMTIPNGANTIQIEPTATLDVKGNIVMNGVDLEERLSTIETVLQIPTRDATMEAKHPKLAKLYKEYMKELEKYKTWDRIKGDDNVA